MDKKSLTKQVPRNLITNIATFLFTTLISLWLVPYLVKNLGKSAYGFIPLAMVFTYYIGIISASINTSIARYLTIAIQKKEWKNANEIFNSAIIAIFVFIVIQALLLYFLLIEIDTILTVPPEFLNDVKVLFLLTFLGYFLSLISSVFTTIMFAYNRIDLQKGLDILRYIFRFLTIILCFSFISPNVKYVGLANIFSSIAVFIGSFIYYRKTAPELKINPAYTRFSILKKLSHMGFWTMINTIGTIIFLRVDIFLINKFLGTEKAGEYAILLEWSKLLRVFAGFLTSVINPLILISYSNNRIKDVIEFEKLGIKTLSIIIGVLAGLICAFAHPLLTLWVGFEEKKLAFLLILIIAPLSINISVKPMFALFTALNKVRIPGIITLMAGLVNLGLAILFLTRYNLGMMGVALSSALILTLKNLLFDPIYSARILNLRTLFFYNDLLIGVIIFLITWGIGSFIYYILKINNWIELILGGSVVSLILGVIIWRFLFSQKEKTKFLEFLLKKKLK